MYRFSQPTFARLALVGLLAAALGLAACGRKGPLDSPPGASLEDVAQPNAPNLINNTQTSKPVGTSSGNFSGGGADGRVQAQSGPKKRIFLDSLLN